MASLRPGDWVCPSCSNHNYASRTHCNRCGTPKVDQASGAGGYDPAQAFLGTDGTQDVVANYQAQLAAQLGSQLGLNAALNATPAAMNPVNTMAQAVAQAPAPEKPAQKPRPGDWYCPNPQCMNLNYASRIVCNRCQTPPSHGNPQLAQQLASMAAWGMGGMNLGNLGALGMGQLGQLGQLGQMGQMGQVAAAAAAATATTTPKSSNARPGDWMCPSCNNHNYASRLACNRCQTPKPENALPPPTGYALPTAAGGAPGKMRPGDWMCPSCGNHNYASRVKCNRCQTPKPEGTTAGMGAQPY